MIFLSALLHYLRKKLLQVHQEKKRAFLHLPISVAVYIKRRGFTSLALILRLKKKSGWDFILGRCVLAF